MNILAAESNVQSSFFKSDTDLSVYSENILISAVENIRKNKTTYLLVYANKFPESKHSNYIIKKYGTTFNNLSNSHKFFRSKPARVFTLHPMLILK